MALLRGRTRSRLVVFCWCRDDRTGRPFAVALILFGLLFGVSVTVGRASFGLFAPSRYAECGLFVLAGCYLAAPCNVRMTNTPSNPAEAAGGGAGRASGTRARGWGTVRTTGLNVIVAGIALEVVFGTGHGFASAKKWSTRRSKPPIPSARTARGPPPVLLDSVGQLGTRSLSSFLMATHDLSVLGTARRRSAEPPLPGPLPRPDRGAHEHHRTRRWTRPPWRRGLDRGGH